MYIDNMNRETQAHTDNGHIHIRKHVHREYEQRDTSTQRQYKKTHARETHTHTHNVKVYTTYISLPWCVRGTLLDLRLERGSINSLGLY